MGAEILRGTGIVAAGALLGVALAAGAGYLWLCFGPDVNHGF